MNWVMDTPGVTSRLVLMMPSLKKLSMYSVASCICGVSRVQLPSSSISETPNAHGASSLPCRPLPGHTQPQLCPNTTFTGSR